jgi:hypothetical protein
VAERQVEHAAFTDAAFVHQGPPGRFDLPTADAFAAPARFQQHLDVVRVLDDVELVINLERFDAGKQRVVWAARSSRGSGCMAGG